MASPNPSHGYSNDRSSYEGDIALESKERESTGPDGEFAFPVDYEERRRILRKMDVRLLPFVSLLYMLSFLDRSNIGNAKVAGLAKDLHLVGLEYNVAAAVFFIPYCFAEVPSNILLKLVRPSRWIPSIMVAWGLVMTLMCLVKSYHGLIITRVFLGLTEAGLFPGVTYYLSLWYPRDKLALRVAIFFSAATIAGAFGGILAYGIERMEGIGGLHGWQWIFCLEGIATVLVAFASYFVMHDYPETATFLTESERSHVIRMLKSDAKATAQHFDAKFIWQAFGDYKTYIQILIYMGVLVPVYGISLFLPTIILQLGFSSARAQLLTVPPFVAGCLCTVLVGFMSDRVQRRGYFVIGGAMTSLIGYLILYTQTRPGPGYLGAFLAAMGVFPTIACVLAWCGGNAGGDVKRGVVLAMVIGLGNLGGICSSFIYFHPPRFHVGHGTLMGFLSLSIVLSAFSVWNYDRLNKLHEDVCAKEGITGKDKARFEDLGDQSPLFRYVL